MFKYAFSLLFTTLSYFHLFIEKIKVPMVKKMKAIGYQPIVEELTFW